MLAGDFSRANLSDAELSNVQAPTIVSPGTDVSHPESLACELLNRLPEATWADAKERWTPEEMAHFAAGVHASKDLLPVMPLFEEFIERVAKG